MLIAEQGGQVRNASGLTAHHARCICVTLEGSKLPWVVLGGRDAIPPDELGRSVNLESEDFNRRLWAWGPEAKGVYDLLHPRSMELLLNRLPDGTSVTFGGQEISLIRDQPHAEWDLNAHLSLLTRLAGVTPRHFLGDAAMPRT